MIIEFIGLMGAGKSTLHRETVERLIGPNRTVWTPRMLGQSCGRGRFARVQRLWFRMRAAWRSRTLVVLAMIHLFRSNRPFRDKLKGLRWFLTSLGNRWKARQSLGTGDVALIDEGLAQRMFNIFIHGAGDIDLDGVRKYARALPLSDVLVYLTVDPHIAAMRTAARTKKLPRRFRSLDREQLSVMFANAEQAIDTLVDEIRLRPNCAQVIVIESDDLPAARRQLTAQIDALLSSFQEPREHWRPDRPKAVPKLLAAAMPNRRRQ
jgi:thymidylate kinase